MKVIKHKLIKIVVIFFVGSFLLFPPAYSEMIDLKEGFDWTDYALTMAIGAFQAYTASVDESISMVLLKNFVIPVAADKATENINNSLLRATVRGALIAGSTGWLDYKSAATQTVGEIGEQAGEVIAKETAKQTATQVTKGAYVLKEAYKGAVSAASWQYATENFNWGSLERFKGSLNYLVSRLAVQTLAGGQGGIVDNVANEEFWDEFLVECGRVGIEVGVKVMLEAALNKEIDEGIISALGQGLSKAILEKRNEQFKDSDKDMTKEELEGELKSVGNEKAALEVEWKELSAKDVSEMTSIEKKEWKSKRNELIKKLKQKTERLDALSTQIEIRISHQMQADSQGRLAYRRGESLNGIKRNITEEVAKRKDLDEGQKERLEKELKGALEEGYDLERLEAAGEGKDKWPLLEELSEQEKTAIKRGELRKDAEGFVRAGFNSNVQELKVRKELGAEADKEGLEGRDKERFVREGMRYYKQVKKKGLLSHQEAASEAGQAREKYLQARGDAYEAMTKMNRAKQEIATMGRGKAFALGVLTGAISAGLEKVSSKFGSPFDGAIINAGLTSIFYSAMVPDKYIFEQEIPLGDLQDEQSFEPAIERIQHSKGFLSKFRFYSNKITDTFTQANAQALSGGKADAVIYTDSETGLTRYGFKWRPSDSGSAVRDAQRWQTIAEEGVMAAMYDGYISSLHYQSVNNLRDVAKGWHNKPYVMTAKPPTWTQRQYLLNQAVEAGAGDIIRRSAIQDIGNIITGNATILINAVGFDALVEEAKEILGFDVNDKLAEAKTLALLTGVGVGVDQAKKLGLSLPSIGGDPLLYLTQKADDLEKGKVDQSEFKQGKVFINEQGDKLKITRVEDDKEKKGEKRICYAKYAKGNDIRPVESGFDLSLEEFAVKAGGETKDGSLYLSSDEQRKETAKALREYIDMRQQARYGVRWEILAFSLPVDYAKKSSYVQNDIIPKIREAKVRQEVNKELAKEIGKIEQGVKNEFGYEEKKEAMLKGRWKKLLTEGKVGVDVIEAGKLYKEWSELKKEYKKELVESIKERRTEIEEGTENTEGVRDKWEERMPARTDRWKPSVGAGDEFYRTGPWSDSVSKTEQPSSPFPESSPQYNRPLFKEPLKEELSFEYPQPQVPLPVVTTTTPMPFTSLPDLKEEEEEIKLTKVSLQDEPDFEKEKPDSEGEKVEVDIDSYRWAKMLKETRPDGFKEKEYEELPRAPQLLDIRDQKKGEPKKDRYDYYDVVETEERWKEEGKLLPDADQLLEDFYKPDFGKTKDNNIADKEPRTVPNYDQKTYPPKISSSPLEDFAPPSSFLTKDDNSSDQAGVWNDQDDKSVSEGREKDE